MKIKGTELTKEDQRHVLNSYVHRFTFEHKPHWANVKNGNGKPYQPQFKYDQDWLEHTMFYVRKDRRLDQRMKYCESNPTWPNGKEVQK